MTKPDGNAIVYCEGAFNTPNGKTAHGLVRFTQRYRVLSVIDSRYAGQDAREVLDQKHGDIPVVENLQQAIEKAKKSGTPATHFVIGLAPDGGRLSPAARQDVKQAIICGLNVDCGLHDFLSEDRELVSLADQYKVILRDVRKPPSRDQLHFFSSKIEQVTGLKIAVLGTDSAVGKRTTAWILVHALSDAGFNAVLVGTGQTAWMQGVRYGIILDSLVNDFVSGEIEHAVWSAWRETAADAIVLEGQGSLLNPAYPGGFELLAAARPDVVVLQHAPARIEYDGFPGYPIQPLTKQIQAIEMISGKPVVAVTLNHENMDHCQIPIVCDSIKNITGCPAFDVLLSGGRDLISVITPRLAQRTCDC
jgi:uncharacterized NAD-dependent epimerase/dehydratase family protein